MAKEFSLVTDPNPTVYRNLRILSQAYQVGDALAQDRTSDGADVVPATSSTITAAIFAVAMSAQVSTDTSVLSCLLTDQQTWSADATNTPNTNHNYQRMVLTDKGTVNNTGTDSTSTAAVFEQTGILSGNRITGRFLPNAAAT